MKRGTGEEGNVRASSVSEVDLRQIIGEFPLGDDFPGEKIPVRSLASDFDNASAASGGMKVFLRVRPVTDGSVASITVTDESSVSTIAPEASKRSVYTKIDERHYRFTRVFGSDASQVEIFGAIALPMVERFVGGESCVLFAYGMTNAGKTHSIQGTPQEPGIFPRIVRSILQHGHGAGLEVRLSMLEVYQDKIFDLLSFRRENLHIRDNGENVEIGKLGQHSISDMSEALKLLEAAGVRRSKASTSLNAGSSRSHAVYSIALCGPPADVELSTCPVVLNTFHVIDLAGSERGSRTKTNLSQQREANNINTSLMQLWRCINALRRRNTDTAVIPFRDNKLTHILMPSLGRAGLDGVAMLVCVNPHADDYDETVSVLGNASLACEIREIADVRLTQRMSASATERAVDRANNRDARAALLEGKKRRVDNNIAVPPAKYAREGNKGASKRSSDLVVEPVTASSESALVAQLREQVALLAAANQSLLDDQAAKEGRIRAEVSAELEERSGALFAEISSLQTQVLALRETRDRSAGDVTKSCKKARQKQRVLAGAGASEEALRSEEELERAMQVHELEVSRLRTEKRKLELELANWKAKYETAQQELSGYQSSSAAKIVSCSVGFAAASTATNEFSQRMQRDPRFKSRKSPVRSPLGNLTNSPIKLQDLSTAKGQAAAVPHLAHTMEAANDENVFAAKPPGRQLSPYMQRLRSNYTRGV